MLKTLTNTAVPGKDIIMEESVLNEIKRFIYCPDCLQPISQSLSPLNFCDKCEVEAMIVIFYHHNVPKINGYLESEDECSACQLLK